MSGSEVSVDPERRGSGPAVRFVGRVESTFEEANLSGARALAGVFLCELDALPFAQQLEHGATDRAAMEEMLDSAFVADESEPFVDQKASDSSGRHTRVLR
jgi:hypothetical protein